jgi:hypothetical protein
MPSGLPYSPFGFYGYAPDPMFQALATVPPMWRPQNPGETFGVRVLKNTALVLMEALLQQFMLATRQAFLPPPPRPADPIIDVTPQG